MDKYRAIPEGYQTVGEVAKLMKTTVRTLQYYDREGLLKPGIFSDGGRRLYSDKDIIKLHQILSLKYLGFSLEEIKDQLISLETPNEVAENLAKQELAVKKQIEQLNEVAEALGKLKQETLAMDEVNFRKYADIISMLQLKNENFWVVKNFDDKLMDHIRGRFDEQSGDELLERFTKILDQTIVAKEKDIQPESDEGQRIVRDWWGVVMEFTGGDLSLVPELIKFAQNRDGWNPDWSAKMDKIEEFIAKGMEIFFSDPANQAILGEIQ